MLLCAALLLFFPALLLKKGYALHDVIVVAVLSRRDHGDPRLAHAAGGAAAGGRPVQGTGQHRHRVGGDLRRGHPGAAAGLRARSPRWAASSWASW